MSNNNSDNEELIKSIDNLNDMAWRHRGNATFELKYIVQCEEMLQLAQSINYQYGVARCHISLGMIAFIFQQNPTLSLSHLTEALNIFKTLDNKKWIANASLTLGIIINSTGKPENALYHAIKGIEYYEKNPHDKVDVVMAYYVIGTVYKDLKKHEEAEKYYKFGIENKTENDSWIGRIYTGLSNIYNERGNYEEALDLALKSLELLKTDSNKIGESRALTDIGGIYRNLKNYDQAMKYLFEALALREEANVKNFELGSLLDIAALYHEINENENAIKYLLRAEEVGIETNHKIRLSIIFNQLAKLYKASNNYIESIKYYEKYIELNIELNEKETSSKIQGLESAIVKEKIEEIERLKNIELKNAYGLISEKNKEITDSIQYAKRIQKALLAPINLINSQLKDSFILFKPKDIVSGDFYWATSVQSSELGIGRTDGAISKLQTPNSELRTNNSELQTPNSELFYLAVCDSTGHGVPGAFMSLLNTTFLNEAINEKNILQPNQVLNYVRERLISTVSAEGGQDGMDGILLCFEFSYVNNEKLTTITYAAANNAPILISKQNIIELPCDKMPIGKGEKISSFNLYNIDLKIDQTLYLYTDGYADQFGGPKGKKFKYKSLNDLLLNIQDQSLNQQLQTLDKTIEDWKGNLEQVDDICLIGIKI